jgi:hypothetical protein
VPTARPVRAVRSVIEGNCDVIAPRRRKTVPPRRSSSRC